jgi:hypothetical protein
MHQSVGRDLPKLTAMQDLGAVEREHAQEGSSPNRNQETADDHADHVRYHKQRRDVNRIATHPRHRLVVI